MSIRRICIFLIVVALLSTFLFSPEIAAANPESPSGGETKYHLAEPAYDSGWFSTGIRVDPVVFVFDHNLGGIRDQYFVQLDCRDSSELGHFDCTNNIFNKTAHWYGLTDTQIKVWVTSGSVPDLIRVRIWRLNPDYTSGWVSTGIHPDPISMTFYHYLYTSVGSTLIELDCWDGTELGYYDCTNQAFDTGAHWYNASSSSIAVYLDGGYHPDNVRVRIYKIKPKFDTGWISVGTRVDPITMEVSHSLGCPVYYMHHQIICLADRILGTYDCTNHGFGVDAHWYDLSDNTIDAFINNGTTPSYIRVLIYDEDLIYIPLVFD